MTRPCAGCATPIDDHKHARYTIRGDPAWYCTRQCVDNRG